MAHAPSGKFARFDRAIRILLVEDSRRMTRLLRELLCDHSLAVAPDSAAALQCIEADTFDLILVGARASIDVVHAVRRAGDYTPIAIYDALARTEAEVAALLDAGADDVILSPVDRPREFLARIRVLQRHGPRLTKNIELGHLVIDHARREVFVDGELVPVTRGEYRLLYYLARRPGVCLPRAELYAAVFETVERGFRSNALAAAVSRLRPKLGAAGKQLVAVAGIGYRLDALDESDAHSA